MTRDEITKGIETLDLEMGNRLSRAWINGQAKEFKIEMARIKRVLQAAEKLMMQDVYDAV